jgi:hypothetical protein
MRQIQNTQIAKTYYDTTIILEYFILIITVISVLTLFRNEID